MVNLARSLKLHALELMMLLFLAACIRSPAEITPTAASPISPSPSTVPILSTSPANTAVLPTAMPLPSATPCWHPVQPDLAGAWDIGELGCPVTPGTATINTAYAPFEDGQMLWRGDTDTIYVLFNDGRWESYPNEWREGDPEYSCGEANSPPTPLRGFGRVWCDHPEVSARLGAVTASEIGDNASAVQEFVNGMIMVAPFGARFVLVGEDGTWRRVDE